MSAEAGESAPFAQEEYRALRATIRERGTARVFVVVLTVVAWAALSIAGFDRLPAPFVSLMTLVVLVAGFEANAALHIGVERVGRYIQATYERTGTPGWERLVAQAPFPRLAGQDPLYAATFLIAALINLLPSTPFLPANVSLPPSAGIAIASAALHLGFAVRVVQVRRFVRSQHARDLQAIESR